jgi:hypothetical protein
MKYPPVDFVRVLGTGDDITLSTSADGKNVFRSLNEEQFYVLVESIADRAKALAARRRIRIVNEVPAFAEEMQPPSDTEFRS